jgi:hypothetical protein
MFAGSIFITGVKMATDKTCNGGFCIYKQLGTSMATCGYWGYCDYQCPKDSRNLGFASEVNNGK